MAGRKAADERISANVARLRVREHNVN